MTRFWDTRMRSVEVFRHSKRGEGKGLSEEGRELAQQARSLLALDPAARESALSRMLETDAVQADAAPPR